MHERTEIVLTVLLTTDFDVSCLWELSSVLAPRLQDCAVSAHLFYYENLSTSATVSINKIRSTQPIIPLWVGTISTTSKSRGVNRSTTYSLAPYQWSDSLSQCRADCYRNRDSNRNSNSGFKSVTIKFLSHWHEVTQFRQYFSASEKHSNTAFVVQWSYSRPANNL